MDCQFTLAIVANCQRTGDWGELENEELLLVEIHSSGLKHFGVVFELSFFKGRRDKFARLHPSSQLVVHSRALLCSKRNLKSAFLSVAEAIQQKTFRKMINLSPYCFPYRRCRAACPKTNSVPYYVVWEQHICFTHFLRSFINAKSVAALERLLTPFMWGIKFVTYITFSSRNSSIFKKKTEKDMY